MEKEQIDECTKKFQQRWKKGKEAVNITRSVDRRKKLKKAEKQYKLLKDQERENEVQPETWKMEEKKCLENMYKMKAEYFKRK